MANLRSKNILKILNSKIVIIHEEFEVLEIFGFEVFAGKFFSVIEGFGKKLENLVSLQVLLILSYTSHDRGFDAFRYC